MSDQQPQQTQAQLLAEASAIATEGQYTTGLQVNVPDVHFDSTNRVIFVDDYQRLACRTAPPGESTQQAVIHCALGLATEAGEYTTEVKRMAIYGKPLDNERRAHMLEELGDAAWYIAYACAALDASLATVLQDNIDKLRKRFPDKFTTEAAEARADKGGLDARNS